MFHRIFLGRGWKKERKKECHDGILFKSLRTLILRRSYFTVKAKDLLCRQCFLSNAFFFAKTNDLFCSNLNVTVSKRDLCAGKVTAVQKRPSVAEGSNRAQTCSFSCGLNTCSQYRRERNLAIYKRIRSGSFSSILNVMLIHVPSITG